ncbi:MAG: PPC domain-containing protein, partial [Planctomycetota bacterium]
VFALNARELIPYLPDAVPGWFQAVLALYDSKGKELKFADDFRFHPDPVLAFEVPEDGEYVIAVYDNIFRGREDFVYRLAAGELPFVSGIFPLGGKVGEPTSVEMRGWHLPEDRRIVDFPTPGIYPLFVRKKHDALSERKLDLMIDLELSTDAESVSSTESVSNRVPFAADTLPECLEQEPNDSRESPQQAALPIIVNGRIDTAGDWDVFRFEGRAGQVVFGEVRARRLGSPLDSVLRVTDATGKQLALNDEHEDPGAGLVTHHSDSMLRVALPADGTYFVHLGDIQQHGGTDYAYRLRISPPRHDFELRIVPSSINIRGGGTVALAVHALRRDGFSGEIALALKNTPRGFKLHGAQVPDGQDQVRLTLTAPAMTKKRVVTLSLEGRATIDGHQIVRPVVPAENMMQAFVYWHLVPVNELKAVVSAGAAMKTTVAILSELPVSIPAGGTAAVRMGVPARGAFDQVHLELDEPPEGIVIEKESPSGQGTEIVLKCDAAKQKPGLKGNLIVNAFAVRSEEASQENPRPRGRPTPLGMLPAIPFEIVAAD